MQEGFGFIPSDEDEGDDDAQDYICDEDRDIDEDAPEYALDGASDGGDAYGQAASQIPTAPATEPPPSRGAAADAEARRQARKSRRKKSGRLGIVEQLKAKAEGRSASNEGTSATGAVVEGGNVAPDTEGKREGGEVSPPAMGLLDAVAAMILGEHLCRSGRRASPLR